MLTLATLYAFTGLAWLAWTGRLANAGRAWETGGARPWQQVIALLVVLVIWPVGVWRGR